MRSRVYPQKPRECRRPRVLPRLRFAASVIVAFGFSAYLGAQTASWRSTTSTSRWTDRGTLTSTAWSATTNHVELFPDTLYQTVEGFGGCFSEKGWDPIVKLAPAGQDSVLRSLFDTSGCNFNICRLPIGANDFAEDTSYYSLDDTPGDYSMSAFNLSRDSLRIIPFIKAAMVIRPDLVVWASPWTPPQWMKTDGLYYGSSSLKQDTQTLNAYALYLEKAVNAFKAKGITVSVLAAQNEPTQGSGQAYPSCVWTPSQYFGFYRSYLIPRFKADGIGVKIMWGTFCCGNYSDWIQPFLTDTALLKDIPIFGLQRGKVAWAPQIYAAFPGKTMYQTETDCCHNGGTNDWSDAVNQFDLLASFMNGGSSQFSEWNMVLDQSGLSGWNWKQTSMITIDTSAKTVTYNPSFYGVKHWTHYIQKDARRIKLVNSNGSYKGSTSAYRNPDGSIAVLAGNEATSPYVLTMKLGNRALTATLPAQSLNTFVVRPDASISAARAPGDKMALIGRVRLRNAKLSFTVSTAAPIDAIDMTIRDLRSRVIWTGRRSGAELRGGAIQTVSLKTGAGGIPSGCYLFEAAIRSGGSVTRVTTKIPDIR